MNAGTIVCMVVAALAACCLFAHRRVIRALIHRQPMPKAPKWHFRVDPKNRRS